MWGDLGDEVRLELSQLKRLVSEHGALLGGSRTTLSDHEAALLIAAVLHSFYTGVENVFRRIAARIDGGLPRGQAWHRELLDVMASPSPSRPAVISTELRDVLDDCLRFRHFFRNAYSSAIELSEVSALGRACPGCLSKIQAELDRFLASGPPATG